MCPCHAAAAAAALPQLIKAELEKEQLEGEIRAEVAAEMQVGLGVRGWVGAWGACEHVPVWGSVAEAGQHALLCCAVLCLWSQGARIEREVPCCAALCCV